MSADYPDLSPGADVAARLFDTRWINHVTRGGDVAQRPPENPTGNPASFLTLDVLNDTGDDIDAVYPILRLTTPVTTVADNAESPYNAASFKGDTPDSTTGASFVVVQGQLADGVARKAVLIGLTWCRVQINSSDDTHATTIDGDNTKLTSGSEGVPIKWKESGTGEKWALIVLGGGGSSAGFTLTFARLIRSVPASGRVWEAAALEDFSGGAWSWTESFIDDGVYDRIGVINPMPNSNIQPGSLDHDPDSDAVDAFAACPRIWGKLYMIEDEIPDPEDEEATITVSRPYLAVMGPLTDITTIEGFELEPDNETGQVILHDHNSLSTIVDGGPCNGGA